jgi:hypothetical protein
MGGYLNKISLQGNPFDTDVRVLREPRTVPYDRIGSLERIRTVSVPYRPYLVAEELKGTLRWGAELPLKVEQRKSLKDLCCVIADFRIWRSIFVSRWLEIS